MLWETLLILAVLTATALINRALGTLVSLGVIGYLLIERQARHRPWAELGFSFSGIGASLRRNWPLILLVSVVIQLAVVWGAQVLWPELLDHIAGRIPFNYAQLLSALPLLLVATFMEELLYRALFQERLGWFLPVPAAIVGVSLIFGLAHYSPGPAGPVAADVALVILDSVIYGIIYARGRNVLVAWLAHCLADVIAILLLINR
ncbi:MAG: CPBP family intramembrane metalloprotease [Anaerolineales bacterium]|nr:CPBP family intramembrane metalloprotease [Anaerolineales bacterium]